MSVTDVAEAIYTVNRHAKTAIEPQHLYTLKRKAIEKLLQEKKAKKIGLHFSNNPKQSNQHSTLLIQVEQFYFHIPPAKEDFKQLPHLGSLDDNYRNPKIKMSLSRAKHIIYRYLDWYPEEFRKSERTSAYYIPSSLGKKRWPPTKRW